MQLHSRKQFKKEKTAKGRARQIVNYSIAKLRSSGLFDTNQKNGRVKVRRIADMADEEKAQFGVSDAARTYAANKTAAKAEASSDET